MTPENSVKMTVKKKELRIFGSGVLDLARSAVNKNGTKLS